MPKYQVLKDCDWQRENGAKAFSLKAAPKGRPPKVVDETDLVTPDGKELPPAVKKELLRRKALVPVPDEPDQPEAVAEAQPVQVPARGAKGRAKPTTADAPTVAPVTPPADAQGA